MWRLFVMYIKESIPINTVHSHSSTTIDISQLTDVSGVIRNYLQTTFRPFSENYLQRLQQNSAHSIFNNLYSSYLASVSPSYFATSPMDIYYNESLLKEQLASPKANLNHPIIDQLWFTISATKLELHRLSDLVKQRQYSAFCELHSHSPKNARGRLEIEVYEHCLHFKFSAQKDHRIVVYHGLRGVSGRQNPIKVAFNPARFTLAEIKAFFTWIRKGEVFDDFVTTMSKSNVTRLDIATDFIGISTPMFLVVNNLSKHTDYEPKKRTKDFQLVQTQVLGEPAQSHYDVYSRNHKLISVATAGMLLLNDTGESIPITRVERCWRPQKSNTPCNLADIVNAPNMLKSLSIYSPRLLKEIQSTGEKIFIATHGFSHWLYSGREKVCENVLKRELLFINKTEFGDMQTKALKVLRKVILGS